jgi:hypothetical protein
MAVTTAGARLTEAHRSTQAKTGALVAYAVAKLWMKTVHQENLEESTTAWMRLVRALLLQQRGKSTTTTRVYYPAFRKLELPNEPMFSMPKIDVISDEQIFTALRVTGPIAYQKAVQRVNDLKSHGAPITPELEKSLLDDAFESASKTSGAAAMRLTLDGGRDQLEAAAKSDKLALGWARVTQANPCYFCAMLASRGFDYGKNAFAKSDSLFVGEGKAKVHDGCQCTMEPSFSHDSELPGTGAEWEALWASTTGDVYGKEKVRKFRAAVEGRKYIRRGK